MSLSGQQFQQLSEALRSAFTRSTLAMMLRFRLEKNLDDISLGGSMQEIVFELIETAEREGWTEQLILAARYSNPGNPQLLALTQESGIAPVVASHRELERVILDTNSWLDVAKWRTQLAAIEAQVARIEIQVNGSQFFGTGFLLGSDVVITNYHVMEPVIPEDRTGAPPSDVRGKPEDVVIRFDYKRLPDGRTLNKGTEHRLASDWLIDLSPPSQVDDQPEPKTEVAGPDELDYALLRLDANVGSEPAGGPAEPGAPPRGWVGVPNKPYDFQPDSPLFIMQHPDADPLQLALDTRAVIGVNQNGTRVLYRTNTLPGSSGSPCFNQNWELVALHHSGDPNFAPSHKPLYNEGVPFTAIVSLLQQRGAAGVLGV